MEKYLEIQWDKYMVFRDSLQFLASSLDSLSTSLTKSGTEKFIHLHKIIGYLYPDSPIKNVEQKKNILL
jgi:hypothetical protein